jgi:multidrug efflux pump subunit AcrB
MVRIESTSGNDGQYTAHLYFKPKTDPESARKVVQSRVALAEPVLPDVVRRNKVAVRVGKAEVRPGKVAIAVIDRGDNGWNALQKVASALAKRLAAEDTLTKPQVFPRDEKQVSIDVDRAKCNSLGVTLTDVSKAVQAAGSAIKPEGLKKLVVRDKVSLGDVAAIKEVYGPAAVYRVDLSPAIRIIGAPPEGKSVATAAAKCVDLTQAELKRLGSRGFAVENLAAK